MTEDTHVSGARGGPNRGRFGKKRGSKGKKNMKMRQGSSKKVKIDPKMKKTFLKRAREYNSDSDEDQEDEQNTVQRPHGSARKFKNDPKMMKPVGKRAREYNSDNDEEDVVKEKSEPLDEQVSSDEMDDEGAGYVDEENRNSDEDDFQPGFTKLTEGCRAFKLAFNSIMKKTVADETLGPVLSAHKKLVIEKLAEEDAERKSKGEAKKEKHLLAEKGHVKPPNFLDAHEKFLIGVATKGVVKLFNAVNKAQSAQKGLNPSRSSDAKVIKKRRKEAFFSELGKTTNRSNASNKDDSAKGQTNEGPAWAPLRDNYMLTNSKLKDWDKKTNTLVEDDIGRMSGDNSSDSD